MDEPKFTTSLQRLASYRPIIDSESSVFYTKLANAGFKYQRTKSVCECVGCGNQVRLDDFTSQPTAPLYHKPKCQYIQTISGDISYDAETAEEASVDLCEATSTSAKAIRKGAEAIANACNTEHLQASESTSNYDYDWEMMYYAVAAPPCTSLDLGQGYLSTSIDSGISTVPSSSSASFNSDYPDVWDNVYDDEDISASEELTENSDSAIACAKNVGHYNYFPVRMLDLQCIPSQCRYPEVLGFLKAACELVVRVVVKNKKRPNQRKIGTGSCFEKDAQIISEDSETNQSSKWGFLKKLRKKSKAERIYVETNRHIVFDNYEAQHTTVEFFYDHPNRRDVVKVKGVAVKCSGVRGDNRCILECKTSDPGFVDRINKIKSDVLARIQNFSQPAREALTKMIFVIAHPHGREKVLSYGDCEHNMAKYAWESRDEENGRLRRALTKVNIHQEVNRENTRKVLLYTASTCQGSSGAPVITFKLKNAAAGLCHTHLEMDLWMHNGIDKRHGLGGSVMKVLTDEDVANHGNLASDQSTSQDNESRNTGEDGIISSFTEVRRCPVSTVGRLPSYPAYSSHDSRWKSFAKWNYGHIHDPATLTEAGFFYAGYADCVRCFHCGLGLRSWKPGDDLNSEHYKHRPTCFYLQTQMRVKGITDPATPLTQQPRKNNTELWRQGVSSDIISLGAASPQLSPQSSPTQQPLSGNLSFGPSHSQNVNQVINITQVFSFGSIGNIGDIANTNTEITRADNIAMGNSAINNPRSRNPKFEDSNKDGPHTENTSDKKTE